MICKDYCGGARILIMAALLMLALTSGTVGRGDDSSSYIVMLEDHVAVESVEVLARQISGSGPVYRHALRGFAIKADASGVQALRRHPDIAFVAEDAALELHGQFAQPGMLRIRVRGNELTAVNDVDDLDLDVDIAVIDSGIDSTHPDLRVHRSVSFVASDPNDSDLHGHGTHIAGIVGAIDDDQGIHGVAPGARLWSLKVVDAQGAAALSDMLAALDYVVEHADEIDVVNISLGTGGVGDDGACGTVSGDPLHQAICATVNAGVVVVVSAGNHVPVGRDASLVRPACYDEVITVSAVVETDGLGPSGGQGSSTLYGADNSFARSLSNYGWDVDLAAPGVNILSTSPGGGYVLDSGTSMAAAHVSGAAAVWVARYGKPSDGDEVRHVREELVRLGFPQFGADEGFSGDKETFAEPLVNVAAIDPGTFDPVEPQLHADRAVYISGQHTEAVVTAELRDQHGQPLSGIPGNGFQAYLGGRQREVAFQDLGQGNYSLTLNIDDLLPGDYDFTALIRDLSGFERSSGCRIVVRDTEPGIRIHGFSFAWPVLNHNSYTSTNPLKAALMDETGAPVPVSPAEFETVFTGGGEELSWTLPAPDFITGVSSGITYATRRSQVDDIHTLPLGTYHADLTVAHRGLSDSASTCFAMAYNEPSLEVELNTNLSRFDFTQTIEPPALDLRLRVTGEYSTGIGGLLGLVTDPMTVKIDGQNVPGVGFVEDFSAPGTYLTHDIDLSGLTHGLHQLSVQVTDTRGFTVESAGVVIDVVRETLGCADPFASAGQADADADGVRDECDNCPGVSNASQRNSFSGDFNEVAFGDACKSLARLRVSSNPGDLPDFATIQQAVDAAGASSTSVRIQILPGTGPYLENVVVDRGLSYGFVGVDLGSGPPVVEYVGAQPRIFDLRAGAGHVVLENLVIRGLGNSAGQTGVSAATSTRLTDVRFEGLESGLLLQGGDHIARRIAMDQTVSEGVRVEDATLTMEYGEFLGTGQAIRLLGATASADLSHLLLVGDGAGDGVRYDESAGGSITLRHATVVNCGTAIRGNGGPSSVAHSIFWNNQTDLSGLSCHDVGWSSLTAPSCGGTNLALDPRFVNGPSGDYRLAAGSQLIDHGPDPRSFDGAPCTDLAGSPRLLDHDGDGLAQIDPGVFERANVDGNIRAVEGLLFSGPGTLEWQSHPEATRYHVYRLPLDALAYSAFGSCADGLDAVPTDTVLVDDTLPAVGEGFAYEITAEDSSGFESGLGLGTCAERSNFIACP